MNNKGKSKATADAITSYRHIHLRQHYAVERYCQLKKEAEMQDFLEKQFKENASGYNNRFIVIPQNITETMMSQYSRARAKSNAELGGVDDLGIQRQLISEIAIWMLMSNRNAKACDGFAEKCKSKSEEFESIFYETKDPEDMKKSGKFYENYGRFLDEARDWIQLKNIAFCTLCACLNVLNYNNVNNNRRLDINYGMIIDPSQEYAKDAFVIDVPLFGQMCIHLGSECNLKRNIQTINKKTRSILEHQIERQLNEQRQERIKNKIDEGLSEEEAILQVESEIKDELKEAKQDIKSKFADDASCIPEYQGKLFETSSAIPLRMRKDDPRIQDIKSVGSLPTKSNVEKLLNMKDENGEFLYNPRETHYLAVKFGWSKSAVQYADNLADHLHNKKSTPELQDIQDGISEVQAIEICQSSVLSTTAEERQNVKSQQEQQSREKPSIR